MGRHDPTLRKLRDPSTESPTPPAGGRGRHRGTARGLVLAPLLAAGLAAGLAACTCTPPPGTDGGSDDDAGVVYDDLSALGDAILAAQDAREDHSWLDVATPELPAWAVTTEPEWQERVESWLAQVQLPAFVTEVPESSDGASAQAVIHQGLSSCKTYSEECTPATTLGYTCTYTALCGTAWMEWVFVNTLAGTTDYLTYYGHDHRWDYGVDGFLVEDGFRAGDAKSLLLHRYTNPDNPGLFSEYVYSVDGEATVYTPWGTDIVFTVHTVNTMFLYDFLMEEYRPNLRITMEHHVPHGPVVFIDEAWSISRQAMTKTYMVTFTEDGCQWVSYDDDGMVRDTGPC